MKFFKTWIDWWVFVPLSLLLAVGSYWFVPMLIGEHSLLRYLSGRFIAEQHMQYTGTAWLYSFFQCTSIFMFGIGLTFLSYRWFFPGLHKYLESDSWEQSIDDRYLKIKISLLIPAVLFIGYCLICLAAFK